MTSKSITKKTSSSFESWQKKKKKVYKKKSNEKIKMEEKKDVVLDVESISLKRRTKIKPSPGQTFVAKTNELNKHEDKKREVKFSNEQLRVFTAMRAGKNVLLTSGAGTGKSFVGQAVIRELRAKEQKQHGKEKKNHNDEDEDEDEDDSEQTIYSVAPTATAARIIGGTTLHSYLGLPLFFFTRNNLRAAKTYLSDPLKRKKTRDRLKRTRILFIDEISMVSPRDFCWLDEILRSVRNSRQPLGGVQLLVCGDFYQLPPVIDDAMMKIDSRRYCFQTLAWTRANFETIMLTEVFRQREDLEFYNMLNKIRVGEVTPDVDAYFRNLSPPDVPSGVPLSAVSNTFGDDRGVYLAAYRHVVASCNAAALAKLNPSVRPTRFSPTFLQHPKAEDKVDKENKEKLPTMKQKEVEQTKEATVELKVGALVMLNVNWSMEHGIVNGRRGTITKLNPLPSIVFDDDPEQTEWSIPLYRFFHECLDGVLEVECLPLALSFATTFHRSQGQTLKNGVVIDLGVKSKAENDSGFGYGMAYVVLSRAPSANRIRIINWRPEVIKADPLVKEFYDRLNTSI